MCAVSARHRRERARADRRHQAAPGCRRWDSHELTDPPIVFSDPGEFLIVAVSRLEIDELSADDSLGESSMWLWRNELAAIKGTPTRYVLSRLRGDGGEYAVEITLSVE
jgi:hypothetical protein